MEKLLEQAQKLVADLAEAKANVGKQKVDLDAREIRLDERGVELNDFQAELLQREASITPIENVSEAQRVAAQSKAEADLEWAKIRGDWEKLDQAKAKFNEEMRIGKSQISEQKELYERGARENAKAKDVLEKKLKAIQQAGV
jgi:hypothetical protein